MPASRSNRAQHYPEGEEAIKRPTTDGDHDHAPNAESEAGEQPGLPDLTGAPVTPEAWLHCSNPSATAPWAAW